MVWFRPARNRAPSSLDALELLSSPQVPLASALSWFLFHTVSLQAFWGRRAPAHSPESLTICAMLLARLLHVLALSTVLRQQFCSIRLKFPRRRDFSTTIHSHQPSVWSSGGTVIWADPAPQPNQDGNGESIGGTPRWWS